VTNAEGAKEAWRAGFALQVASGERLRAGILAALAAGVAVVGAAGMATFPEDYGKVFSTPAPYRILGGYALLLALYEGTIRVLIQRRLAAGKTIPESTRYGNATVEVTAVSALMALIAGEVDRLAVLVGPLSLLYGIFIVLSVLRLSPALSIYTGLLAALEYCLLALVLIPLPEAGGGAMGVSVYHLGRGTFLGLTGLASGFVAAQIRRQVVRLVQTVEERGRLLTLFGQQVSAPIVRELTRSPDGPVSQKRRVAVMFLDIRDFTRFATQRRPEEVVEYQNAVFGFMLETVARHHGIVNQLLGDGFMATFGAPVEVGNSSANAVAAGREILGGLSQRINDGRLMPTRIGIGIHAGEAIVGNVGTSDRKQYSVTGTVVILAARIESMNKELGSQFLISEEVWKDLGAPAGSAETVGPVVLKGRIEPVSLFRLA